MYKIVGVGGKFRGKEILIDQDEVLFGRSSECDVIIDGQGISKKHFKITRSENGKIFLEDLGSSNGIFVNGILTKNTALSKGDELAIPGAIFKIVLVRENKILVDQGEVPSDKQSESYMDDIPSAKDDIFSKLNHLFESKIMGFIHGFNEEHQWKILLGIFVFLLGIIISATVITPVISTSRNLLELETAKRAIHYAKQVQRLNSSDLARKKYDSLDVNFLKTEEGVSSFELFDLSGNVYAPIERANLQINDPFSIEVLDKFNKLIKTLGRGAITQKVLIERRSDKKKNQIGVALLISAYNQKLGDIEPVGIIAFRFQPETLNLSESLGQIAYLKSILYALLVSIFFYGIFYYLSIRPITELTNQADEIVRGVRGELNSKLLMDELTPLKNILKTLFQKVKESSSEDGLDEFNEIEDDDLYVEKLKEFLEGSGVPTMILDSQKNVRHLNYEAEDLLGIRESSSEGENILDCAREKGFAGTIIETCDNCANADGKHDQTEYELVGSYYKIFTNCLIGKDGFAKAFYLTFLKED